MPRAEARCFWCRTAAITPRTIQSSPSSPRIASRAPPAPVWSPRQLTEKVVTVPNEAAAALPDDLSRYQQILLEKQTLDIFQSAHADELVKRFGPEVEFVVFGVVTEFCVGFAAKGLLERGRRVSVVRDAIETLNSEDGKRTIAELQALGASFITTEQALARLDAATLEHQFLAAQSTVPAAAVDT